MRFPIITFVLLHFLFIQEINCQLNTYIKTYDLNSDNNGFGSSLQTKMVGDKIYLSTLNLATNGEARLVNFTELNSSGAIINTHLSGMTFSSDPHFSASQCFVNENNEIYYFLSETPHFCIWKTSATNEILWKNAFSHQDGQSNISYGATALLTPTENFIFSRFAEARIFVGKINSTGENNLLKKINLQRPNSFSYEYEPICSVFHEGDIFIAGQTYNTNTTFKSGFYLKTDEELNVETAYSFENFIVSATGFFANGDILFFARTAANEYEDSNLLLLRFSHEMVFIKGIELSGFNAVQNVDGIVTDEQEIYYRFTGKQGGERNIILKFDENLSLEWAKDFENTNYIGTKTLQSTPDGKILFAGITPEFPNNLVLYKMTKNGEIEGYSFNELCVNEIIPFEPEIIEYTTTEVTPPYDSDASFISAESNISLVENDVEVTNLPLPDFSLPTRICANNCTAPTILQNETADSVKWYFENGIPEYSTQKSPGQICFSTTGLHLVRQKVFYNNCEKTFERIIEVEADFIINLGANQSICHQENILLDATNATANTYVWNNGSSTSTLSVNEPGMYSVTVSNQACETSDTILINAINPEPHPISLPQDTIVCRQHLPFVITPNFAATEDIIWQDGRVLPDFTVTQEGIYTATIEVEDCSFVADIEIEIEDCSERIYIPNVFSPDNDGVNDVFRAEGRDFIVTQMLIYDRWGSLIFQANTFDAAWDGRHKGDFVGRGVFVYVISYQNTLLGVEETVSGDVLVLK